MKTGISTVHPNGTKFTYMTDGEIIQVNLRPNADGKTFDARFAYYYKVKSGKPGVLVEYPDGVKRFISNSWYE